MKKISSARDVANEFIHPSELDPSVRPKGAGILKGKFFLREDIDLTKPIWEQVFRKDMLEEDATHEG